MAIPGGPCAFAIDGWASVEADASWF